MTNYEFLKRKFRNRKAEIEPEITSRFNIECCRGTDIFCASWNIKMIIESMRRDVQDFSDSISRRERKTLIKYIEILDCSMWSRLYDIAGKEVKN